eukprot:30308-Pelagococcus_subviridis.AAC.5
MDCTLSPTPCAMFAVAPGGACAAAACACACASCSVYPPSPPPPPGPIPADAPANEDFNACITVMFCLRTCSRAASASSIRSKEFLSEFVTGAPTYPPAPSGLVGASADCDSGNRSYPDIFVAHSGSGPFSASDSTMRSSPTLIVSGFAAFDDFGAPASPLAPLAMTGAGASETCAVPSSVSSSYLSLCHTSASNLGPVASARHLGRARHLRGRVRPHRVLHRRVRASAELDGVQQRGGKREFHDDGRRRERHPSRALEAANVTAQGEEVQHFFRRRRRRVLVRGGAVVLRERTDAAGGDAGEERRVGSRRLRGSFHARVSVGNARGARVHARARAVPAVRERLRLPERGEDANLRRGLALLALKRRRRQREPRPRGLAVGGVDRRRLLHRADVDDRPSEAALAVHDWREEAGRERGGGGAVSRRTTGRRGGDDATTRERASATGRGEEMMPRAVASRRAPDPDLLRVAAPDEGPAPRRRGRRASDARRALLRVERPDHLERRVIGEMSARVHDSAELVHRGRGRGDHGGRSTRIAMRRGRRYVGGRCVSPRARRLCDGEMP